MIDPSAWTTIGGASSPCFSTDGETISHLRGADLMQVWSMRRDGSSARRLASQDECAVKLRRALDSDLPQVHTQLTAMGPL